MKKYFIAALALVAAIACSKDDVADPVLETSLKSVTINIKNLASGSRAEGGKTASGSTVACAAISDVYFLFADASGKIVKVFDAGDTASPTQSSVAGGTNYGGFTYHAIPENVTQVAAVANVNSDPQEGENLSTYKSLYETENVNAAFNTQVVYAVSPLERALDASSQPDFCDVEENKYPLYKASMTLSPYTARIEITHIGCTDFGTYDAFGISSLSLASGAYTHTLGTFNTDTDLTAPTNASFVLNHTNVHNHTASPADTNYITAGTGLVWSWNIKEQTTSDLVMNVYTKGLDYTVAVANKTATIKTYAANSSNITTFKAGNIYRFAIDFSHNNLDGDNTSICANVDVTIANWVVNDVTVGFGTSK